ncbi:hypothetical protein [Paenibacillus agilis]|uniref:Extracellular solute-binding protein n=1 Tax=Paenibacillus agilis TaxID=3020863 RepID=A0A559IWW7_9BACL|nr:hypothetical protein [Paenibacillus agilis]TVX92127.1 hypothetical protein FPZ44_03075 [Paenibacillus agilis]
MCRQKRGIISAVLILLFVAMLSGCGKEKADVTMFIMNHTTLPAEVVDSVETSLNDQFKDKFTVDVVVAPTYSHQKLMVEFMVGENSLILAPTEDIQGYVKNGGALPIDKHFDSNTYPEGVMDGIVVKEQGDSNTNVVETHLFALPADKLAGVKKLGLPADGLSLVVPIHTPNADQSMELLKVLEGR